MSQRLALAVLLMSAACAPQTGLVLEVQGPSGVTSVDAQIVELELITAQRSWCDRWVSSAEGSGLRFSVAGQDLDTSPATILLSPDQHTDLAQPVRALVLARDPAGQVVGVATFDAVPFKYEEVRRYSERISLIARGADPNGPNYLADDGCVCLPGRPWIGLSGPGAGSGCDQRVPPSFARLVDTAGCELPPGASLPIGVCDGQLYPGERANRDVPCYAAHNGTCRIGARVCNDENGRAVDRACTPNDSAPTLPTSTLCDAFLACEKTACGDPIECLKGKIPARKALRCTLPISPIAAGGAAQACVGGSWSVSATQVQSTTCAAAMLDSTRQGPVKLGWQRAGGTTAEVSSSLCPPTFVVEKIDVADPTKAPAELSFAFAIDDQIYDVTMAIKIGCDANPDAAANDLRCDAF